MDSAAPDTIIVVAIRRLERDEGLDRNLPLMTAPHARTPDAISTRWLALAAPSVLAAATIVSLLADFSAPMFDAWRPLGITVASTLIVQFTTTLVLRDRLRGAYATGILVSITLGLWALVGILLVIPAWWWSLGAVRRLKGRASSGPFPIVPISRFSSTLAGIFLLLSVGRVVLAFSPWDSIPAASTIELPGSGGPDIFVVLLDGYPRADTLENDFGIDNAPFISSLENEGFVVDGDSRTNYMKTWLTITSLFHTQFVSGIPAFDDPPPDPSANIGSRPGRSSRHLSSRRSVSVDTKSSRAGPRSLRPT